MPAQIVLKNKGKNLNTSMVVLLPFSAKADVF